MWKALSILLAAAVIAGAITLLPAFTAQVEASTPPPVVKGDRLDIRPLGTACSQRGWPYFERSCLRDRTERFQKARDVRIVSSDRLAILAKPSVPSQGEQ